jgi:hypothetical protein
VNDGDDFAGQHFEFASGKVFLAQLNVVHTTARSLSNIFQQTATASHFIPGELGSIGDVVEKQSQPSVFSLQSSVTDHPDD